MSYPRTLIDVSDHELVGELRRRAEAVRRGLCDYCNRPSESLPVCKFPYRHGRAEREKAANARLVSEWARLYDQTD